MKNTSQKLRLALKTITYAQLASCAIVIFVAICFAKLISLTDDPASWVQASGSLIGIAIAIWVPARQHANAKARADSERLQRMRAIGLFTAEAMRKLAQEIDERLDAIKQPTDKLQSTGWNYFQLHEQTGFRDLINNWNMLAAAPPAMIDLIFKIDQHNRACDEESKAFQRKSANFSTINTRPLLARFETLQTLMLEINKQLEWKRTGTELAI